MQTDMINAMIATGTAEFLTVPLCTIKTRYQINDNIKLSLICKEIYKYHGLRGFYKASLPAIGSQIVSTTGKYVLYQYFNKQSGTDIKFYTRVCNGICSGILTSFITHPLDVIRTDIQKNLYFSNYKELLPILYRGYSKTFIKICIGSALFFPLNDILKNKLQNPIISSATTAIIATTIMHPIDYLKTRHMAGNLLYTGYNPKIYYRGLSINLLRIVPHFTITMTLIDYLQNNI